VIGNQRPHRGITLPEAVSAPGPWLQRRLDDLEIRGRELGEHLEEPLEPPRDYCQRAVRLITVALWRGFPGKIPVPSLRNFNRLGAGSRALGAN
jgi:hypothetical protein